MRTAFFTFGVICHAMFFGVFLYMACFVGNLWVPKTIDAPHVAASPWAVPVNAALLLFFAVPHSVMARPAFKRWWTRFVPNAVERSVYVLIANLSMILLLWQWQPIPAVVWDLTGPVGRTLMWALFVTGWLLVPAASLMIQHFDLFGTRQTYLHLRGRENAPLTFRTPMLYRLVRHPLYVGWIIAFWATPTMTLGHLMFASVLTAYMLIAIPIEERDLVDVFGKQYEDYRRKVPALIPGLATLTRRGGGQPASPVAAKHETA